MLSVCVVRALHACSRSKHGDVGGSRVWWGARLTLRLLARGSRPRRGGPTWGPAPTGGSPRSAPHTALSNPLPRTAQWRSSPQTAQKINNTVFPSLFANVLSAILAVREWHMERYTTISRERNKVMKANVLRERNDIR